MALSFLGIPFAKAPVGQYRFALPRPVDPWTQPLMATKFGPGCPQTCLLPNNLTCPSAQSEDCLQLNIYVPANPTINATSMPVLVFLPGGNFRQGGADTYIYDSRLWVNRTEAIVVTTNYRLGALGFLIQDNVPRNLGIEDQREALRWVRANIAAFGGNPSQITLQGQSAGATSIGYHLLSPKSAGLFDQVISESNPMALPLKNPSDGAEEGDVFMKNLGCASGDLQCLLKANVSDIIVAQDKTNKHFFVFHPFLLFYPWTPVVDVEGAVERQPVNLLMQGKGLPVPKVFGTVANESLFFIYLAFGANGMSQTEYVAFVADAFPLHIPAILERYPTTNMNASWAASFLATDFLFTCPTRAVARAQSNVSDFFLYKFDHPLSFGPAVWGPDWFCYNATCHAGELPFIFWPLLDDPGITPTDAEKAMSLQMQRYWVNFAWASDPSAGPYPVEADWTKYETSSDNNLRIQAPNSFMETNLKKAECDFWDTIGYDRGEDVMKILLKRIMKNSQKLAR